MPSFKISAAILATALLSTTTGQAQFNIDPSSVPISTRTAWCQSQLTSCPLLCLQLPGESSTTESNTCDATTLDFTCICGNGLSPNASQFSQTIPFFECQQFGNQCVAACNGDSTCQAACRDDNLCGAQDPTRVNTTSSSAMPSTTLPAGASSGTAGVVFTGLGGAAATQTSSSSSDSNKSSAERALDLGRSYGLVAVFSGLFVGFALVM